MFARSTPPGGQNSDLQNLTLKKRPSERVEELTIYARGSNIEGQELPPLLTNQNINSKSSIDRKTASFLGLRDIVALKFIGLVSHTFTHSSLTLHTQERRSSPDGQNMTLNSFILLARELVDKFYSRLGQRPSKIKREKSIEECLNLLLEGFTVEEVDYASSWLMQHHPTTSSFSRLSHFIDQAIKEWQTEQQTREIDQEEARAAEHQRVEQQHMEEERQQIEEAKALLPPETLDGLYQEAKRLIEQESPGLKFGKDLMIQVKLNELVKLRYLP